MLFDFAIWQSHFWYRQTVPKNGDRENDFLLFFFRKLRIAVLKMGPLQVIFFLIFFAAWLSAIFGIQVKLCGFVATGRASVLQLRSCQAIFRQSLLT